MIQARPAPLQPAHLIRMLIGLTRPCHAKIFLSCSLIDLTSFGKLAWTTAWPTFGQRLSQRPRHLPRPTEITRNVGGRFRFYSSFADWIANPAPNTMGADSNGRTQHIAPPAVSTLNEQFLMPQYAIFDPATPSGIHLMDPCEGWNDVSVESLRDTHVGCRAR